MLLIEPTVSLTSIYVAFNFGVLYAFIVGFQYVFEISYGFDLRRVGLTFLGLGGGSLVALVTGMLIDRLYFAKKHKAALLTGKLRASPEH